MLEVSILESQPTSPTPKSTPSGYGEVFIPETQESPASASPIAEEQLAFTTEGVRLNPDGTVDGGFILPGSGGAVTIKEYDSTPASDEYIVYTTEGASFNNDGTINSGVMVPGYPVGPLTIQESPTPVS